MTIPPEVFAKVVREHVQDHQEWDSLHKFLLLHWDGEKLIAPACAMITPEINPQDYRVFMAGIITEHRQRYPEQHIHALLLQVEGYCVLEPDEDAAGIAERDQFDAATRDRQLHEHPGAFEITAAVCADINGGLWQAMKRRDTAEIREHSYQPGREDHGRLANDLLGLTTALAIIDHGRPIPEDMHIPAEVLAPYASMPGMNVPFIEAHLLACEKCQHVYDEAVTQDLLTALFKDNPDGT